MWFDVMGSSRKVGQHHALLNQLSKETPPGYNNIRVDQLVRADRELFTILSQEMQGSLKPGADGVAPLDARVRALITDPRITMFMLPLPSSQKAIKEDIERNALKDDPAKVEKPPELKKVKKQRAEKACPEELKKIQDELLTWSHLLGIQFEGWVFVVYSEARWQTREVQQGLSCLCELPQAWPWRCILQSKYELTATPSRPSKHCNWDGRGFIECSGRCFIGRLDNWLRSNGLWGR